LEITYELIIVYEYTYCVAITTRNLDFT